MKLKILVVLFFASAGVSAQRINDLDISVFSNSKSYPFLGLDALHPGVQIGTSIRKRVKERSERNYNVYLGFYHQKDLENAFFLRGEYAHTFIIAKKFGLNLPFGLGYLHTFYPGELFAQESDGSFTKVSQLGRGHLMVTTGVGISYRGFNKFEPYIQHDIIVQYPFGESTPFLPNSMIRLGIKFNIQSP